MKIIDKPREFGEIECSQTHYILDNNEEDLSIFNGMVGFRVFDKEKYADDFINGYFRTQPLNWYAQEENKNKPFYDPEEGVCDNLFEIDLSKEFQVFNFLDGQKTLFDTKGAEIWANKNGFSLEDYFLYFQNSLSNHALCFTWCYFDEIKKFFEDGKVLAELRKFGPYMIAFSIKELFSKCNIENNHIICGGKVIYNDKLSNHFLVKKEKFQNEHEFRFLFNDNEPKPIFHQITPFKKTVKFKIK